MRVPLPLTARACCPPISALTVNRAEASVVPSFPHLVLFAGDFAVWNGPVPGAVLCPEQKRLGGLRGASFRRQPWCCWAQVQC